MISEHEKNNNSTNTYSINGEAKVKSKVHLVMIWSIHIIENYHSQMMTPEPVSIIEYKL